ncbi:MAG: hypothetical protein HY400_05155 [Elusimicrobia bacterium]|nr:hypothetical protein [Elusimicrobiota bacterium]
MKKTILVIGAILLSSYAARAWQTSEQMRSGVGTAFHALSGFKPRVSTGLKAVQVQRDKSFRPKTSGSKLIHLTGYTFVSGDAFVRRDDFYAMITVSGWARLQDQEGRTWDGWVRVSDTGFYYVGSGYVSGIARPYAYVSLYQDGKYLGTTSIEGSIYVSGFNTGGRVSLSGSGYVSGDLYVESGSQKTSH